MKEIVFLNNEFLPGQDAGISVLSPALLCGWGVFETMRSYKDRIVRLDRHIKRIKNSARLTGIPFPFSAVKLEKIIRHTVKINGLEDARVRLNLLRSRQGAETLITAEKYCPHSPSKYRQGFSAQISRFRQDEFSPLAGIKSTNRLIYELSLQEAKAKGFDEAIMLNSSGNISEAARSNIFLVKDKALFTPGRECGCLEGITRKVIFNLARRSRIKIYEGDFTIRDLSLADGAFLTNSLIGVMPLSFVGGKRIGRTGGVGLTGYFMREYDSLLKNGT